MQAEKAVASLWFCTGLVERSLLYNTSSYEIHAKIQILYFFMAGLGIVLSETIRPIELELHVFRGYFGPPMRQKNEIPFSTNSSY